MEARTPRVLLIEDDPGDVLLVRRLAQRGGRFQLQCEATLQAGLDRLAKGETDVLLLDLHLPDSQGLDTLERVVEQRAEVPIAVFTVTGDDETALSALQTGAQDYLVKGEITDSVLARSIRYAIERKRIECENESLQKRLADAERLQSLAALALGTSCAFNTHLGDILDRADDSLVDLETRRFESARSGLIGIRDAALQAAQLSEQIRTFAGANAGPLRRVDLSNLVVETSGFFEQLVPSGIEVQYDLGGRLSCPAADRTQLRQLLTQLVVNAHEAIGPRRGMIRIQTGSERLDRQAIEALVADAELAEGEYVFVRVRDDGRALESATRARMFEPFFTTKFQGRGLGLAAVRGIVRRHGGAIGVDTPPDRGTAVTVYLPADARN